MSSKALVPSHLLAPAGTGNLDAYIQEVYKIPMLTLEEEQALAAAYRDEEDLEAARRLVLAHLRFVVHVAKGYAGYGLNLGDLVQEGNIGLMKAVKRFDPEREVRLVSFAVHWIRAEMHEFILRNWRIVKVATTKAQRKLFFNLRKSKKRLGWLNMEEVNQVAKDLGEMAGKMRDGKIAPKDIQGGCITLSNLGGLGGKHFTPIVNIPEVAILGVGRASYQPVWKDDKFEPRLMMPLSLSYDHRLIDGADGTRFLRWVIEAIEQPLLISLEG